MFQYFWHFVPTICWTYMKFTVASTVLSCSMQIENRKNLVLLWDAKNLDKFFARSKRGRKYFPFAWKWLRLLNKVLLLNLTRGLLWFRSRHLFSSFSVILHRDQLFSNQLYLEIDASMTLTEAIINGSLTISVVSYRNLTYFLPKMYFSRNR